MFSIENLKQSISQELSNLFEELDKKYCVFLSSQEVRSQWEPAENQRCTLFIDKAFDSLQDAQQFVNDFFDRNIDKDFIKKAKQQFVEYLEYKNAGVFLTSKGKYTFYYLSINTLGRYIGGFNPYYNEDESIDPSPSIENFLSEIDLVP